MQPNPLTKEEVLKILTHFKNNISADRFDAHYRWTYQKHGEALHDQVRTILDQLELIEERELSYALDDRFMVQESAGLKMNVPAQIQATETVKRKLITRLATLFDIPPETVGATGYKGYTPLRKR